MEGNNPYKDDVDFAALAIQDPQFAKVYVNLKLYLYVVYFSAAWPNMQIC